LEEKYAVFYISVIMLSCQRTGTRTEMHKIQRTGTEISSQE